MIDSPATYAEQTGNTARQLRLFRGACLFLGLVLCYYFVEAKTEDFINKIQGLIILGLAALPSLLWIKSNERRFPMIEVLLLTTTNAYAFPILSGHEQAVYPLEILITSGWVVIAFQAALLIVYYATKGTAKRTPFWSEELIKGDAIKYLGYGVVTNTIYLALSDYTTIIPGQYDQTVRAVCFGISIVCTFVTAQLIGYGKLNATAKTFFFVNIALQFFLQAVTLFLVGAVSTTLLVVLGYVTSKKKVPFLACAVVLVVVAVLHNGEPPMRAIYWSDDGTRTVPPLVDTPAFFQQWVGFGLAPPENKDEDSITGKLIQRTSLYQMICLVAYASPEHLPFLDGDTYSDLLAQLVPRPLWPNKPSGLWSTYRLSIYYGLQNEEGTYNTSIAFGQVAEAYANFGFLGVIGLGGLLGFLYKKIQLWAKDSPIISFPGLLLVVLMAWSFQTEFTLSTWVSSLFQACVCVFGLLTIVRNFLR